MTKYYVLLLHEKQTIRSGYNFVLNCDMIEQSETKLEQKAFS